MARAFRSRSADDRCRDWYRGAGAFVTAGLLLSGLAAFCGYEVLQRSVLPARHLWTPANGHTGRKITIEAADVVELTAANGLESLPLHQTQRGESVVGRQVNGELWTDEVGGDLQGHGGFILQHEGLYYWYGEVKRGPTQRVPSTGMTRVESGGIAVYSSPDLRRWRPRGLALPVSSDPAAAGDLRASRVLERPRVLYSPSRRVFVMWLHVDSAEYGDARAGVAVAQAPEGPFQYRGSFRPNREESRDLTVFKDDDGAPYLLYASNGNNVLHLSRMTNDYLSLERDFAELDDFENLHREAPIMWRFNGLYYIWTSGASGWGANRAQVHVCDDLWGPWLLWGSPPCSPDYVGDRAVDDATRDCNTTFGAQGTAVVRLSPPSRFTPTATYLWMGDRWVGDDLARSGFVWYNMTIHDPWTPGGQDDFLLEQRIRNVHIYMKPFDFEEPGLM